MQWNTMLSLPMKWIKQASSAGSACFFQYFSQSLPVSNAHCFVAEMYPMGASSHTYSFLPAASSSGRSTPTSRSPVIDHGCRPGLSHEGHSPYTLDFKPDFLHSGSKFSHHGQYFSTGRHQWLVSMS